MLGDAGSGGGGRKTVGGGASAADSVRVCCRVRPLSAKEEITGGGAVCVSMSPSDPSGITCSLKSGGVGGGGKSGGPEDHRFNFSKVFPPETPQRAVYEDVALPVLQDVLNGYNGTIFMYGQTGSGKTHTMFGKGRYASGAGKPRKSLVSGGGGGGPASLRGDNTSGGPTPRLEDDDEEDEEEEEDDGQSGVSAPSEADERRHHHHGAQPQPPHPASGKNENEEDEAASPSSILSPMSGPVGELDSARASLTAPGPLAAFVKPRSHSIQTNVSAMTAASGQTAASLSRLGGPSGDGGIDADSGIIPRVIDGLFESIYNGDANTEYEVRLFFVEVYCEKVRDLLGAVAPRFSNLRVREDVAGNGFYLEDCETPNVGSPEDIMRLVRFGLRRRKTSATQMNEKSSRSHCILNITVKSFNRVKKESKVGKLFLVDLAGSEKAAKSKLSGEQLEEAKKINASLTALGKVIVALTEPNTQHVPYRESILTKILKDSLGGNSKTTLVICCSPAVSNAAETLSTLRFGQRAKNIKNKAVINRQLTVEELQERLEVAVSEIRRLKGILAADGRLSVAEVQAGGEKSLEDILAERAAETRQLNEVVAAANELRDQLRTADGRVALARQEADGLRRRVQMLEAEARAWEEAYAELRHRLQRKDSVIAEWRGCVARQSEEIELLIAQMESTQTALKDVEEAVREQVTAAGDGVLSASVSRRRRHTILALEGVSVGGTNTGSRPQSVSNDRHGAATGTACMSATNNALPLMSPLPKGAGPVRGGAASEGRAGEEGDSPAPKFRAFEGADPSDAGGSEAPARPHEGHSVNAALLRSPSAIANYDALEQMQEDREAQRRQQQQQHNLQQSGRSVGGACNDSIPRTPSPGSTSLDAYTAAAGAGRISAFAANRILELEDQLAVLEMQMNEAKNTQGALASELQLAQKKLQLRQDRIDNLKYLLQQDKEARDALCELLKTERETSRSHLENAYAEINRFRMLLSEQGRSRVRSSRQNSVAGVSAADGSTVSVVAPLGSEDGGTAKHLSNNASGGSGLPYYPSGGFVFPDGGAHHSGHENNLSGGGGGGENGATPMAGDTPSRRRRESLAQTLHVVRPIQGGQRGRSGSLAK